MPHGRVLCLALLGFAVCAPFAIGAPQSREAKQAIRLAWREAFKQGAHDQLKSSYPEVSWHRPSRWKWTVVEEGDQGPLLELRVTGRVRKWGKAFSSFKSHVLAYFPRLLGYVRPPKPWGDTKPRKWTATRTYRVILGEETVQSLGEWAVNPERSGP